jgi:hypothetical protein
MTGTSDLEATYIGRVKRVGSLLLLASSDAVRLLDDSRASDVRLLGVEAFRLFDDGGVQPALDYSNISFGNLEEQDGKLAVTSFKRGLRSNWQHDADIIESTKGLILEGTVNGYGWYEVSLEDRATGELLFFRRFRA